MIPKQKSSDIIGKYLDLLGIKYQREYRFHTTRQWRFDYVILPIDKMIAIEYDGCVFANGRHTRGEGYSKDCDKRNTATSLGWKVYNFTSKHFEKKNIVYTVELIQKVCK